LLGFLALKLSKKVGIPDMGDKNIPNRQRFVIPVLFGIGIAVIEIGVGIAMKLPNIHVPFPFSVPVYKQGIFLELLYHIIPVVLLVWLISNIILRQRWQIRIYWMVAVLLCLWAPIMQV